LSIDAIVSWIAGHRIISFACFILLTELVLRRFAPRSAAYARWTAFFKAVGVIWTAVILSLIYLLSVGPVSLFMRLRGTDLLDREIGAEPSFWRRHEANPLGPQTAVRHQF
jgi:Saxitoxin biosynthesis operon protein SxtJ